MRLKLKRSFCVDSSVDDVFSLDKTSGFITLVSQLDRSKQSSYDLVVVAKDRGTPSMQTEANLRINVRLSPENKKKPVFTSGGTETLGFTENQLETHNFFEAFDPDNDNLYPGEEPYPVCYYVACGNVEFFQVANASVNQLSTKKTLDREAEYPVLYVVVEAANGCNSLPEDHFVESCLGIDTSLSQYLNISINVNHPGEK